LTYTTDFSRFIKQKQALFENISANLFGIYSKRFLSIKTFCKKLETGQLILADTCMHESTLCCYCDS